MHRKESSQFSQFNPFLQMARFGQSISGQKIEPVSQALGAANSEAIGLISRRARAYMELPGVVSRCKTPQDVLAAQQSFWQQSAQDYGQAAKVVSSFWSFALPVTGVEETLEDQSLQSCPADGRQRDTLDMTEREAAAKREESPNRDRNQRAA